MAKTLHIFDYDDTLTYTPTFAEYMGSSQGENVDIGHSGDKDDKKGKLRTVARIFEMVFAKRVVFKVFGDYIVICEAQSQRPLTGSMLGIIEDKVNEIINAIKPEEVSVRYGVKRGDLRDFPNTLGEVDGYLVISEIRGFHKDENTIGTKANEEIFDDYQNARYKMVVTGRDKSLQSYVEQAIVQAGFDFPNLGVHCYDSTFGLSIPLWKSKVIIDTVKKGSFEEVHFYEDKANWLKTTELALKEKFPEIIFVGHHITNVKNSRSI